MSTQKKLITLCFATVFTLGLAACGGGGGGGDAPAPGMMDSDVSLEGKYIPSGAMIAVEDVPDGTMIPIEGGAMLDLAGLGTVECVSVDGCLGTVENGVLTITGDLKIVSVDPALDSDAAMVLAGLAVDMLPDAPDPAIGQREAISSAIAAAMTAVNAVADAATDEEVAAADTAIAAAKMAIADAANVPAEEAAANSGTVSVLETALANAKTSRTAVIAAAAAAEVVRLAAEAAEAEAATKAVVTKAAGTKAKALVAENAQTTDDGIGGLAATADYDLEIARDRTGTTIKIDDDPMAAADDPKFEQAMDLGSGRTMHVRTMDADADGNVVEEVVIVSTDIQAPKATPFGKVADQTLNADGDGDAAPGRSAVARDLGEALVSTNDEDAAVLKNIKASEFAKAAGTTVTHTFNGVIPDDAGTADVDESKAAAKVDGTFNGASGTYKCITAGADASCTVTVNGKGVLTAATDGWIFTPDAGAKSDVADADFLHYGFWLQKTTDKDDVLTYDEVETFAGSSLLASIGSEIDSVTGSASYKGGATGVYVKNVLTSEGATASSTAGHFTATADLKAYFDQTVDDQATTTVDEADTIAPNLLKTISGTISKFTLSGGEANTWAVTLNKSDPRIDGENTFAGTTDGGGDPGKFSGAYHGAVSVDHDDDDQTTNINVAPSVVVGEFDANFKNGSVAGGFGARKE